MRWPGWGRSGLARAGEPGPGAPARWDVCGGAWELPGGAGRLGLRALLLGRLGACVGSRPCAPAQPRVSEPWEPADRICEMGVITASPLRQRQPRPGAHCPHALRPPSRGGGRGRLWRGCLEACSPAFALASRCHMAVCHLAVLSPSFPGEGPGPGGLCWGAGTFCALFQRSRWPPPVTPGAWLLNFGLRLSIWARPRRGSLWSVPRSGLPPGRVSGHQGVQTWAPGTLLALLQPMGCCPWPPAQSPSGNLSSP